MPAPVDEPPDMPTAKDSSTEFAAKKNAVLSRIIPLSLVPISTSNAMLIVSSKLHFSTDKYSPDCYFPLPEYMITMGTISLSLVVMGVISRHIVDWVMNYNELTFGNRKLIKGLEILGAVLSFLQASLLVLGSFLIAPQLPKVVTVKPKKGEKASEYYCDYQLVMFSTVYLSMSWCFLSFAAVAYVAIRLGQYCRVRKKRLDVEDGRQQLHRQPTGETDKGMLAQGDER